MRMMNLVDAAKEQGGQLRDGIRYVFYPFLAPI